MMGRDPSTKPADTGARLARLALAPVLASDDTRAAVLALEALQGLRELLDARTVALVARCRADGMSWAGIGAMLDLTGEGARKRYGVGTDAPDGGDA